MLAFLPGAFRAFPDDDAADRAAAGFTLDLVTTRRDGLPFPPKIDLSFGSSSSISLEEITAAAREGIRLYTFSAAREIAGWKVNSAYSFSISSMATGSGRRLGGMM